jgi:hypothetical protein
MVDLPTGFGNPNWLPSEFLTDEYGEGLPGEPWDLRNDRLFHNVFDMGARFTEPPGGDWHNEQYAKEYPVWQPGAFSPPPSDQILPQPRFSNLPDLGPRDPGVYEPLNINNYVSYGEAVDRPGGHQDVFDFSEQQLGPPPPEAPELLQQSGEQTSTVPIDPTNMIPQLFSDVPSPADQLAAYEEYGLSPTDYKSPPGSGYRFTDNVLKGASGMPFSEMRALSREGAPWQKFVGPAMTAAVGSQIPGAGLLGLFAAGLNKLGAYHQFNPATDSNLFADPETGRATWGTTDPGGSGSQRGTLNLYNMLKDFGGRAHV